MKSSRRAAPPRQSKPRSRERLLGLAADHLAEHLRLGVDEEDRRACNRTVGRAGGDIIGEGRVVAGDPERDGAVGVRGHDALREGQVERGAVTALDHVAEEVLRSTRYY